MSEKSQERKLLGDTTHSAENLDWAREKALENQKVGFSETRKAIPLFLSEDTIPQSTPKEEN